MANSEKKSEWLQHTVDVQGKRIKDLENAIGGLLSICKTRRKDHPIPNSEIIAMLEPHVKP